MSRKPAALDSIETVNILGVNVAAVNMPQLVQVVTEAADSNTGGGTIARRTFTLPYWLMKMMRTEPF